MTSKTKLMDMTDEEFETWSLALWRQMTTYERAIYLAGFQSFERRLLGRKATAAWRARKSTPEQNRALEALGAEAATRVDAIIALHRGSDLERNRAVEALRAEMRTRAAAIVKTPDPVQDQTP